MKKHMVLLAAMTLVIAMAGAAYAVDPTVLATGTVLDRCTVAANGSIAFNIDPTVGPTITASTADAGNTQPTVYCTNGTTFNLTCTPAVGTLQKGGADDIAYAIDCTDTAVGAGYNTAAAFDVAITVTQAGAQGYGNATAGAHTDTITVTLAP